MPWPHWLEMIRLVGTLLVWFVFPLQLWAIHRSHRQFKTMRAEDAERMKTWKDIMGEATRMRQEAEHLRAQAEVALAQARRHLPGQNTPC